MKKIVILSDNSGRSYSWIKLFNVFFPECEIEIQPGIPDEEGLKSFPLTSLSVRTRIKSRQIKKSDPT